MNIDKIELQSKLSELSPEIRNDKEYLLKSHEENMKLLKKQHEENMIKLCYLHKEEIHKILKKEDEIINIKEENIHQQGLMSLFYLKLVIKSDKFEINYSYDKALVNNIDRRIKEETKPLKKLILYILFDTILENYQQLDKSEGSTTSEEIEKLIKDNKNSLEKQLPLLKEYNINLVHNKDIDLEYIYCEIIEYLIKNKKFEEYKFTENIMEQLDLKNICLTRNIYEALKKFFEENTNEEFISGYRIKNFESLINEKIINFFFILLKYVFKHNIYLYNIRFLLETKKSILDILKKNYLNIIDILSCKEEKEKESLKFRSKFILNYFIDSEYYISKNSFSRLSEVLKYFENFHFETKKREIKEIKEIIAKKIYKNGDKYVSFYEEAERRNKRYNILKYIADNKDVKLTEENFLKNFIKPWENCNEKSIHEKKINKLKTNKRILFNYFTDEKNKSDILKIFKQDEVDYFIKYYRLVVVKNYYKYYFFESKKEDIKKLEENKNINELEKYLKDFDEGKKMNDTYILISKLFKIDDNTKTEEEVRENLNKWKDLEQMIEDKNFEYIDENMEIKILKFFSNEKNRYLVKEEFYQIIMEQKKKAEEFIIEYYKQFFPETYRIKIKKMEKDKDEDRLKDYSEAKNNVKRKPLIFCFLERGKEKNENEIIKAVNYWDLIERDIRNMKFEEIQENDRKKIFKFYENEDIKTLLEDIFGSETIDKFINFKEVSKKKEIGKNNIDDSYSMESTKTQDSSKEFNSNTRIKFKSRKQKNVKYNNLSQPTAIISQATTEYHSILKEKKEYNEEKSVAKEELIEKNILAYKLGILSFVEDKNFIIKNIYIIGRKNASPIIINESDFYKCKEHFSRDKNSKEYKVFEYIEDFKDNFLFLYDKDSKVVLSLIIEKTDLDYSCMYFLFPRSLNGESISFVDHEITINSEKTFLPLLIEEIDKYYHIEQKSKKKLNKKNKRQLKPSSNALINPPSNVPQNSQMTDSTIMEISKSITTIKPLEEIQGSDNIYKILRFIRVIGNHNEKNKLFAAEFINELKGFNYYISGGTDKHLKIYDLSFEEIPKFEIKEIDDWTYNIHEKPGKFFFACANKELYTFYFDNEGELRFNTYEMNNITCMASTDMEVKVRDYEKEKELKEIEKEKEKSKKKSNNKNKKNKQKQENKEVEIIMEKLVKYSIIVGRNGFIALEDMTFDNSNNNNNETNITIKSNFNDLNDKTFRNILKLNNKYFVLTSNEVLAGGENKLTIYNICEKKVKEVIGDYSFITSSNGLELMFENNLLCACKQYCYGQKNGILLVKLNYEENQNSEEIFYDTGEFEVYCFCPIKKEDDDSKVYRVNETINSRNLIETGFFFVGGFDKKRREGRIKLYEFERDEMKRIKGIKYLQDIEIDKTEEREEMEKDGNEIKENKDKKENDETKEKKEAKEREKAKKVFKGFKGAVSSLIQSEKSDQILASCYDGKIYLFSKPNLKGYDKKL